MRAERVCERERERANSLPKLETPTLCLCASQLTCLARCPALHLFSLSLSLSATAASLKVQDVMTPRTKLVVAPKTTTAQQAKEVLHKHRLEKLPLVDEKVPSVCVTRVCAPGVCVLAVAGSMPCVATSALSDTSCDSLSLCLTRRPRTTLLASSPPRTFSTRNRDPTLA